MKHLTVDEMIDFVSFNKLENESLVLASRVNAHIFACQDCRNKVEAFQTVYDELVNLGKEDNFKAIVNQQQADLKEKKKLDKKQIDEYM